MAAGKTATQQTDEQWWKL